MSVVDELPSRVAHAAHALLAAGGPYGAGPGPLTAAEVCVYDAPWEALSARHTGAALRDAQRFGLAAYIRPNRGNPARSGYWIPTGYAHRLERQLENRFLRDEAAAL